MFKVRKRGGFSDRNGIKKENTILQINDFDERTRVKINNKINELYNNVFGGKEYWDPTVQKFLKHVLDDVYLKPIDVSGSYDDKKVLRIISETILSDEYDLVLTLVEALVQYWHNYLMNTVWRYSSDFSNEKQSLFTVMNEVFESEYVGYRFVGGIICPISDNNEMDAINEALDVDYSDVKEHIDKAVTHLSNRKAPDYENSIKESILAVETLCSIVTDLRGKDATLGNTIKKLKEKGINIHPALENAFGKLYGYASDAKGIRHAGNLGGPNSTFEEAKFVLVICSAFINYIKGVIAE